MTTDTIDTPDPLWRLAFDTAIAAYDHPRDAKPTDAARTALRAMGASDNAVNSVLILLADSGRVID